MKFSDLQLIDPISRAVREEGYTIPTPIQAEAIPHLLEGRDLLGCAQTGTGKTAAFALPILQYLAANDPHNQRIRALVLTPTRELAAQIDESFRAYGRHLDLHTTVVFGGVGQANQEKALRKGIQILVATPGRLLDLMGQGIVRLDHLEIFVLDEADRMLDMGFIHDVKRVIAALPTERQSLFFSATMPPPVARLAASLLTDPVRVEVVPQATPAERINQRLMYVDKANKKELLGELIEEEEMGRTLVFTRTKHMANKLAQHLQRLGVSAGAIHGNKSQTARTQALAGFKDGSIRVLVATDIAARGIDVEGITHVINYDLPNEPESYVHRIGRTARAGAEGEALSLCSGEERVYVTDIERLIGMRIPVITDQPYHSEEARRGMVDGVAAIPIHKQPRPQRPPKDQRPEKKSSEGRSSSWGEGRGNRRDKTSRGDAGSRGEKAPRRERAPLPAARKEGSPQRPPRPANSDHASGRPGRSRRRRPSRADR